MQIIESERFWLALYPMGQAILSDLSGVPGILLLSNYLELFLVPLAVITSYWLGRSLGLSRRAAGFSVLIQISLYTWMVGWYFPVGKWFYESMAEDKVSAAFLLAPVFLVFVLRFIQDPTKHNAMLVFLSGISLTLTHPVILFFACIIASGLGLFSWVVTKTGWRENLLLIVVFASLMMPYAIIRLYDRSRSIGFSTLDVDSATAAYQLDRYTNVVSDVFYGLNPGVLEFFDLPPESSAHAAFQFVRPFPFVLAFLAGILALAKLKKGPLYWYIFSCVLLVVLATVPYTGWILGYFVSMRLVQRVSWFSPMGIGGALILMTVSDWLKSSRIPAKIKGTYKYKSSYGTFAGLCICFVFVLPDFVFGNLPSIPLYYEILNHNKQLAQVGAYIDQNTTGPVTSIALDYQDILMLPGVSAHTSLISFREETDLDGHNFFLTMDQIHQRIYASHAITSLEPTVSIEERCRLIKEFDVRFVVAPSEKSETYIGIVNGCGAVKTVFETDDLVLLELK